MKDQGSVIALDRTHAKAQQIRLGRLLHSLLQAGCCLLLLPVLPDVAPAGSMATGIAASAWPRHSMLSSLQCDANLGIKNRLATYSMNLVPCFSTVNFGISAGLVCQQPIALQMTRDFDF